MSDSDWIGDAPLTVEQLSDELMLWIQDPYVVAKGIKEAYKAIDISIPLDILENCMLQQKHFPTLEASELKKILIDIGYYTYEVDDFINETYTRIYSFVVDARERWCDTGIIVQKGRSVDITYRSGMWKFNLFYDPCGPEGYYGLTAKSGYALPGANEGALIGRIGSQVFCVGQSIHLRSKYEDRLYFTINDDVRDLYGCGFLDNSGSMRVTITIR